MDGCSDDYEDEADGSGSVTSSGGGADSKKSINLNYLNTNRLNNYFNQSSQLNNPHSVTSINSGGGKRRVPKVFSKEAITKFRSWLFQNLTVKNIVVFVYMSVKSC